jgi:hypothetical protein
MKQIEALQLALLKTAYTLPAPSGIAPTTASRFFRGFNPGKVVQEGASGLGNKGRLGLALASILGAGGLGMASTHAHHDAPAAQPAAAPQAGGFDMNQIQEQLGKYAPMIPAALGLIGGGLGGIANGHPLSGAVTGLGTGAGMTAGGYGGTALADSLGVQNPYGRAAMGLGGGALGGILANSLMNGIVGGRKRHEEE